MSTASAASTKSTASRRATPSLLEVGSCIEAQVRASDSFAHLGDDEFAALLPATPPQCATRAGGTHPRRRAGSADRTAPGRLEVVRVSIGIAGLDPAAARGGDDRKATADEWLSRAQAALHQAKRAGGDRYVAS